MPEPAVLVRITRDGAAGRHGLRARAAALQSVRRGVHGAGARRAWATRSTTRRRRAMIGAAQVRRGLPFNRIEKLQARHGDPAAGGDAVGAGARRAAALLAPGARGADPPGGAGRGAAQRRHDDEDPRADSRAARRPPRPTTRADERTGRVHLGHRRRRARATASRCSSPARKHAGENLADVLGQARGRAAPADPDVRRAVAQHRRRLRDHRRQLPRARAAAVRGRRGRLPRRVPLRARDAARGLQERRRRPQRSRCRADERLALPPGPRAAR